MENKKFEEDLQLIYDELQKRQDELNGYYRLLEGGHTEAGKVVDAFLSDLELQDTKENIMAALTRIVSLREDALEQVLQKSGLTQTEILDKKEQAYMFVSNFHLERHQGLITWINDKKLLTPFYRTIISGVDAVGAAISGWQSAWTAHIINGVNRDLFELFNGDEEQIFEKLQSDNLLDLDSTGEVGDRCYSVLHQQKDGSYKRVAYAEAFKEEVEQIRDALKLFIDELSTLEDEVYDQKEAWLEYLGTIYDAFGHTNPDELITYWANVDRAWMKVTTPIQIGHPLEYYEDHYRKAVALEWDLRIVNPRLQTSSHTRENISAFSKEMAGKIGGEDADRIIDKNITQVEETQLYIGQPVLYYGAEFNGLFSAQVVPNDEQVSAELGKKIFAYADFVMESKKSKPVMKLGVETFGEAFVKSQRALISENPELWHEIYDISTIGHEFGHILWIDSDTEMKMNGTGQFKNIEEFKATTGGLMAFFHNEKEEMKQHVVDDLVSRAVGLMAWREVGEVLPYYCEGLIHLDILFGSGVITYDDQIRIDYGRYDAMKEAYIAAYEKLAKHYLDKKDAYGYLGDYAEKLDGVFLPVDEKIRAFVEHYYTRYKEIGQETVVLD
ncbi:invasion protein CiaB [Sulfurovum mangrovi]|uniref:invasion protein CiaB n=1 Tax=Sulfurovum mangrovi TaxID=2893889 RepID=UPI001E3714C7|nr:invasion protein CiaB [Sulfurovum mangrovi]UFH59443.1 invasion protein CiaB [Sulfurovum mangrovi]